MGVNDKVKKIASDESKDVEIARWKESFEIADAYNKEESRRVRELQDEVAELQTRINKKAEAYKLADDVQDAIDKEIVQATAKDRPFASWLSQHQKLKQIEEIFRVCEEPTISDRTTLARIRALF